MPFNHCIAAALADQLITQDEAQQYSETFAAFSRELSATMPPQEAAAQAARETFRVMEGDVAENRRRTFLALSAQKNLQARLDSYRTEKGKEDPYTAARGFLSQFTPGRNGHSVEGLHNFWRGQSLRRLDQAFITWKRNWAGKRRNNPRLINIVREAFGEESGDAAAMAMAQGWRDSSEMLRQAFNRFGGHVEKLEDWGLPQSHDADRIRRAGFERWAQTITPLLDRARMIDYRTNRPLDDDALQGLLRQMYDNIRSRGWAGKEASSVNAGKALANRHAEERVLHFKDADSWFAYAQAFGHDDPIDAMLGHIDRMSRDIAMLQVLGPNPRAMLSYVKNDLSRRWELSKREGEPTLRQQLKDRVSNDAVRAGDALDAMYSILTHSNADPAFPILADVADDLQNLATAAQIPGVMLAAVPGDFATARVTAKLNGLPFTRMMGEYLRAFDPRNADHRLAALHAGLSAEHYGRSLGRSGRFMMEINGHQWSRWMADRSLALSGLTQHTAAGRDAAGLAVYGQLASNAGREFAALDPAFRGMLARSGIDGRDWDIIRATGVYENSRGATYIRPGDVFERADLEPTMAMDLAQKVNDLAGQVVERAVPSSTLEGVALVRGTARRGTLRDFLAGSLAMYHQYGATMLLTHARDVFHQPSARLAGQYAAHIVLLTTMAGALSIQLKELAMGRDPRDMSDWRFWAAAMSAGGGLSIVGDFIYAGLQGDSRTGKGITEFLTGSRIGMVSDFLNTALNNPLGPASRRPSPMKQNYATGWLQFAKRYLPGTSLWYGRLAMERFIWDQLQAAIDPGWHRRAQRIERWYRQQFGNRYWWHHGDAAPERAPDFESAVGGSSQ
jgi:hypothetical protein